MVSFVSHPSMVGIYCKSSALSHQTQCLSLFSMAKHGVWLPRVNVMSVKDDSCFEYRVASVSVLARRSRSVRGNDTAVVLARTIK